MCGGIRPSRVSIDHLMGGYIASFLGHSKKETFREDIGWGAVIHSGHFC